MKNTEIENNHDWLVNIFREERYRDNQKTLKLRWAKENPEKVFTAKRKWRKKNSEYAREKSFEWAKKNPEKIRASSRNWQGQARRTLNISYIKNRLRKLGILNPTDKMIAAKIIDLTIKRSKRNGYKNLDTNRLRQLSNQILKGEKYVN